MASQFPLSSSWAWQAAVGSLFQMEVILPNTSLLLNTLKQNKWSHEVGLDRYLGTSILWIDKITHNRRHRSAKHLKISYLPRESLLNHSWPSWILSQVIIRGIHILPRLSCCWFLADRDYCSKSIDISTCIHKHPGLPGYKKTQSTAHVFNLTSADFAFFSLL